jgi:hypothetical protein
LECKRTPSGKDFDELSAEDLEDLPPEMRPPGFRELLRCSLIRLWCQNGVQMVLEWCQNGVQMVLEWCQNGVQMVLEWCQNGVQMVLEWCENGVKMVLEWC